MSCNITCIDNVDCNDSNPKQIYCYNFHNTNENRSNSSDSFTDSEIYSSARNLSSAIVQSLNEVEKIKSSIKTDINNIMSIAKKNNMAVAFSKLCSLFLNCSEKLFSLHNDTQQSLLKILALKQDQEVENQLRDSKIGSNFNAIHSFHTTSSCENDLSKVFITFTCRNELMNLKNSKNLISATKDIFSRLDIDINKLGYMPIKSVKFQHIKINKNYEPSLCVLFSHTAYASYVRRKITAFNAALEENGRLEDLRYCEKIHWSSIVWQKLKICYELKRLKLIDKVRVCCDGILVYYYNDKTGNNSSLKKIIIKCLNDIDILRKEVNDLHPDVSCEFLYNDSYFMLNTEQRDQRRRHDGDSNI